MHEPRLAKLVDDTIKLNGGVRRRKDEKPRSHLGASIVGRECWREVYYAWRWATKVQHEGRILRLFERGHREEPAFIEWLETIGGKVRYIDWERSTRLFYHGESDCYFLVNPGEPEPAENVLCDDVSEIQWHVLRAHTMGVEMPEPKQFGFSAVFGHFSGSMDGLATGVPYAREMVPDLRDDEEILAEFKTHGDKSFNKLFDVGPDGTRGVRLSKPEHYTQMVTYMEQKQLRLGLYCAVNKNNDELYYEWVFPNPAHANETILKAQAIVEAKTIPARISNSPSFFKCKFCEHRMICQFGQPLNKNCRTCRFAQPIDNGQWRCNGWGKTIPLDAQLVGCGKYQPITD